MAPLRQRPLICVVTDRRRLAPRSDSESTSARRLVEFVGAAARAGVDLVQIRERDLQAGPLCALVRRCVEAVNHTGSKVLVNDRLDVALAAGAHGVHLRSDSMTARDARKLVPAEFLVGRSVHGAREAAEADTEGGLDYLILGTIFPTRSKAQEHVIAGVAELGRAAEMVRTPLLAIGGVTSERVEQVARAGAAGIAGIGLFVPPPGAIELDRYLQSLVREARRTFDTRQAVP